MAGVSAAILLTGVGKRYGTSVSCFAALDEGHRGGGPEPRWRLQPSTRHTCELKVPLIEDPGYVPVLERLCAEHGVGAVIPLTDLDIEVLARAREEGRLPALVPSAEVARRTYDKYET